MIAHPERNRDIWRDPRKLQPFIKLGCLLQITAGSLSGAFREASKKAAIDLVSEGYAHVIASDGHNTVQRPATLSLGVALIEKLVGSHQARMMSYHTPNEIIQNPSGQILSSSIQASEIAVTAMDPTPQDTQQILDEATKQAPSQSTSIIADS